MPADLSYWSAFFHRAAKEEIGVVIELDSEVTPDITDNKLYQSRPSGFEEYTICVGATPNTIFIVKPGVTLD